MSKIRVLLIALIVIVIATVIFIVGRREDAQDKHKPFRIAVVTWVNHGPFYLAKEKGFYAEYGLDVDIQKIEDMTARRAALLSKNLEGIISSVDAFANGASRGIKAKTVMKLGASDGSDGIVAKSNIKSLSELKGHTVAFEKGTPSHFFLLLALEETGLTSKDIIPRYMTAGDAGTAFVAGNVDACVTWEPWVSTAKEKGKGNILVTSRDRYGVIVDTFVVRNEVLRERPEDVRSFIRGWFDAIEYWKKNPKESNEIMAKAIGVPYEDFMDMLGGVRLSDYKDNLEYFGTEQSPGRYWDVFDSANQIWKTEGLIDTPVLPREYTDISYLTELNL